jgi:hypothetical protein
MQTPSKKAVRQSKGIVSKRSLAIVKKARKQMRKLRKVTIKNGESMNFVDKMLETFGKYLAEQKKLRDAEKPKK